MNCRLRRSTIIRELLQLSFWCESPLVSVSCRLTGAQYVGVRPFPQVASFPYSVGHTVIFLGPGNSVRILIIGRLLTQTNEETSILYSEIAIPGKLKLCGEVHHRISRSGWQLWSSPLIN